MTIDARLFRPNPPWFYRVLCDFSELTNLAWSLQSVNACRVAVRCVRGSHSHTFDALFDEVSAALQFPYYFGRNMNALSECLADLSWLPADAYILVVSSASELLSNEGPHDRRALFQLLDGVAAEWATPIADGEQWDRPAIPFHILLQTFPEDEPSTTKFLQEVSIEAPTLHLLPHRPPISE